jgi:hypothetical protein
LDNLKLCSYIRQYNSLSRHVRHSLVDADPLDREGRRGSEFEEVPERRKFFGGGRRLGQDDSRGLWTKRAGCYLGEQSDICDVEFMASVSIDL